MSDGRSRAGLPSAIFRESPDRLRSPIAVSEPTETAQPSRPVLTARVVAPAEPRWLVLVMLFVLMGALAVPMLWRSPHFSRAAKIILAALDRIGNA